MKPYLTETDRALYRIMLHSSLAVVEQAEQTLCELNRLRQTPTVRHAADLMQREIAYHRDGIALLRAALGYELTGAEQAIVDAALCADAVCVSLN